MKLPQAPQMVTVLSVLVLIFSIFKCGTQAVRLTENEMRQRLAEFNNDALRLCNRVRKARWNEATDIGNVDKEKEKQKLAVEYAKFEYENWQAFWRDATIDDYQDENIRRQLFFLKQLGSSALNETDLRQFNQIVSGMSGTYAQATVCRYKQDGCKDKYTLDPEITNVLAESRDFDELNYYWQEWHKNSGKKMRQQYREYVELMNKRAQANNFPDATKMWQGYYEDPNFVENIDRLWEQVKPLYDELHTYAKYKLLEIYGNKINRSDPNIPAHLLGNMWAQTWENLYDDIKPFKNASLIDITATLNKLSYTAKKMFETSDDFYTSLGLPTNVASFTGESVIEKPSDRIIQCHASAWDFCDGTDYRIKMCTQVNMEDFKVIHHEMGHIQYAIQYKDLPLALRAGANPAFHESIGDTIALSVATPQHLLKIGLLANYADSIEDNINALLSEALKRVAFLPFGLLIDKWRWDVFSGSVPESQWNEHWWNLRRKYQKVSPPVSRSESDFDPGAKYHVPASVPYVSYFLAHVLEFQFYKSLCIEAGQYDPTNAARKPLHKCDFYKSKAAGKKLAEGLKLGASKHWTHTLKAITGETELTAKALLEYFEPLQKFLKEENRRLEKEDEVRQILEQHNVVASDQCTKLVTAEWNVETDINNKTKQELLAQAVAENARFTKEQFDTHFRNLSQISFVDEKIQRQVLYLSKLGVDILDENRMSELLNVRKNMERVYSNAKFCDYGKPNCNLDTEGLTLDPEIMDIMEESTDFNRLRYIWKQWHNKSGALMRNDFKKYVEISNEAARLNGFSDYGDMWRSGYEDPNFIEKVNELWKQIEPLYDELHKYTRRHLIQIYPNKINESDPLIPAHLLGNMWAQTWANLYERIKPFKNSDDTDVTKSLKDKNYTLLKMYKESDRFYKDLGLEPNEMSYTGQSLIEKPNDRVVVCHASAWDFCNGHDFRIKQCTTLNQRNFLTIHHEMGHIEYFILYKDQPITFRTGANPGFHEAIGDLISLSVATPKHLKKIGLLDKYTPSHENTVNALLKMALDRVAFLPFGLLIDLYRWDIFSGKVPETQWNRHWETLREKYQKIRSPVKRSEEHFDAGAKYHIPADTGYIRYFIAHVLQFQFHRALCMEADEYEPGNSSKPLHECDIDGSQKAGAKLRAGLSLGLSKHWKKALYEITGENDISAEALLEYFKPLYEFLKADNKAAAAAQVSEPFETVPVVVGVILGSALLLSLILYLRYYFKNRAAVN